MNFVAITSLDKVTFKIDTIVLDAIVREVHNLSATITQHPIEGGAKITDHMSKDPDMLELECVVTDTPVSVPESHADGVEEIGIPIPYRKEGPLAIRLGPFGNIDPFAMDAEALVKGFSFDFDRVQSVWQEIYDMVGTKVVTIVTSLRDYTDMAIERVTVPREDSITKAMKFTVSCVNIRTVSSKTVDAPVPTIKTAVPKRHVGKAPPQPVPANSNEEEIVEESVLSSMF